MTEEDCRRQDELEKRREGEILRQYEEDKYIPIPFRARDPQNTDMRRFKEFVRNYWKKKGQEPPAWGEERP